MSQKKALDYHKTENKVQNHECDIIQHLFMQIIVLVTFCVEMGKFEDFRFSPKNLEIWSRCLITTECILKGDIHLLPSLVLKKTQY